MDQRGTSPSAPGGYKVWSNVKGYGAKAGDGLTDDTTAINKAISDSGRCSADCGPSTIFPTVVYFPPGTYLVSSPIIQYYNTQFLGDPTNYPMILAAASFVSLGVITSNVYVRDQQEWYLNTYNFLRNIHNFKLDITHTDPLRTSVPFNGRWLRGPRLRILSSTCLKMRAQPSRCVKCQIPSSAATWRWT